MKVVIIGLDSASWNLLMPWIKEGALPTFNKLIDRGVYDYLRSSDPPVTFPAWKCYSTGKNPGKLGVYSFVGLDKENRDMKFHTGSDFKEKEIWEYLSDYGIKSCVINMPGTYPPKKINGIVISGTPVLGPSYAYPEEVMKDLNKLEYKVHPEIYPGTRNDEQEHEHLKKLISSRFDIAKIIMNKYEIDFWHLTIFYIDKIQHSYFKNKSILKDYWQFIDTKIGEFLEEFEEDINLFLMSDHGATEIKNTFYVNEFLLKEGYLHLKPRSNQKKLNTANVIIGVFKGLRKNPFLYTNLGRVFQTVAPETVKSYIIAKSKEERKSKFLVKVDWENSDFLDIGMGFGLIYGLNVKEDDIQKLKQSLEKVKDPLTGDKVADVFLTDEIYTGALKDAPEIILVPNSNTMITEVIRNKPEVWGPTPNNWEGMHEKEGLFLACGPDIRERVKIKGPKIFDLAPTILHMFGLPVPNDMDGRVLTEIFREESEPARRETICQKVDVEREKIKDRVRKLREFDKLKEASRR